MVEYGKRRTCNICGGSVFKKFLGEDDIYASSHVLDDYYFDSDADSDWEYLMSIGDVCPECLEKIRKFFNLDKKEEGEEDA